MEPGSLDAGKSSSDVGSMFLDKTVIQTNNYQFLDEILALEEPKPLEQPFDVQTIFETIFPENERTLPNIDISDFIVDPSASSKPRPAGQAENALASASDFYNAQLSTNISPSSNEVSVHFEGIGPCKKNAANTLTDGVRFKVVYPARHQNNALDCQENSLREVLPCTAVRDSDGTFDSNENDVSEVDETVTHTHSSLNEKCKMNLESYLTDEQLLLLKPKKQRKKAKFESPIPSRFCHVCSRTPKNVRLSVCSKIRDGICRKVVCERCFDEYGYGNFEEAIIFSNWTCPHCIGICPERAQCRTYSRINDRLRVSRLKQPKRPAKRRRSKLSSKNLSSPKLELPCLSDAAEETKLNNRSSTLRTISMRETSTTPNAKDSGNNANTACLQMQSYESSSVGTNGHIISSILKSGIGVEVLPDVLELNVLTWDPILGNMAPPVDSLVENMSLSPMSAESFFETI